MNKEFKEWLTILGTLFLGLVLGTGVFVLTIAILENVTNNTNELIAIIVGFYVAVKIVKFTLTEVDSKFESHSKKEQK